MGKQFILLSLLVAGLLLQVSCAVLPGSSEPPLRDTEYLDLEAVTFTAEKVKGQVQFKENRRAPWRTLKEGDSFTGYALIRSGICSSATLLMKDDNRELTCEICDLISEITINDIYQKLLSSSGEKDYREKVWGNGELIDLNAPIVVCRDSLNGKSMDESESLLAEASASMSARNSKIMEGAAGAAAGGAPSGSSGGCGPGG